MVLWNGIITPLPPPITVVVSRGVSEASSRNVTLIRPSKAVPVPPRSRGEEIVASAPGEVIEMSAVADPRTHHELSAPSWRTITVVTGPADVARMGTSPERVSPAWKEPTTGDDIARK